MVGYLINGGLDVLGRGVGFLGIFRILGGYPENRQKWPKRGVPKTGVKKGLFSRYIPRLTIQFHRAKEL